MRRVFRNKKNTKDRNQKVINETLENFSKQMIRGITKVTVLDFIYKIAPILTLGFLIWSYSFSVKPVFDKYEELQKKQNTIEILASKIDTQKINIIEFANQIDSLEKLATDYLTKIEKLKYEKSIIQKDLSKYKIELTENEKKLKSAEFSAVMVHLKNIEKEVFDEYLRNLGNTEFSFREYVTKYSKKYINPGDKKDEYKSKAHKVLKSYLDYKDKDGYDLDKNILYLSIFYEYHYSKI